MSGETRQGENEALGAGDDAGNGTGNIDVQIACESEQLPQSRQVRAWAERALDFAAHKHWSEQPAAGVQLCVRIVDADEGLALNQTYRGGSKPTNVLSFGVDESLAQIELGSVRPIGDIVLCAGVVELEAAQQGKQSVDHYAHLVVHGVLHLLGFDHEEEVAAQDMECKEVAILRQLGVANPYE